jgi:hypothetical protein
MPGTPTGIVPGIDTSDGAGGINVDLSYLVARNRNTNRATPCETMCWWADTVTNADFPGDVRDYRFRAYRGDRIRVGIAWNSYVDCGGSSGSSLASVNPYDCQDFFQTSFNLSVLGPSGVVLTNNTSSSFDNSFELVPTDGQLVIPSNGIYTIRVHKSQFNTPSTDLGVAWTRVQRSCNLGDVPVPGDYDGDGKEDKARWCPGDGVWFVEYADPTRSPTAIEWGSALFGANDRPVPGDFDGDNKTDYAIWRPTEGKFYIKYNNTMLSPISVAWGTSGDIPLVGDFNNDNRDDYVVWRPSTGTWFVKFSNGAPNRIEAWGTNGDIPKAADFNGDGRVDFVVWRPSNGTWFIKFSDNSGQNIQAWGAAGDQIVPDDFNGDGKTDYAVFRSSIGKWFVL